MSERLSASLDSAVGVLNAAERALITHDVRLARLVLRFDPGTRGAVGPAAGAVRGDATIESILELAMRVADLARIAWRPDRRRPSDDEIAALRVDVGAVRSHAAHALEGGADQLSALTRLVVRADARAAAIIRMCEGRRFACLAY